MRSSSSRNIVESLENDRCNKRFISSLAVGFTFAANKMLSGCYRVSRCFSKSAIQDIDFAWERNSRALVSYGVKGAAIGYFYGAQIGMLSDRVFIYAPLLMGVLGGYVGLHVGSNAIKSDVTLYSKFRARVPSKGMLQDVLDGVNTRLPNSGGVLLYPLVGAVLGCIEKARVSDQLGLEYHSTKLLLTCMTLGVMLSVLAAANESRMMIEKDQSMKNAANGYRIFKKVLRRTGLSLSPAEEQAVLRRLT